MIDPRRPPSNRADAPPFVGASRHREGPQEQDPIELASVGSSSWHGPGCPDGASSIFSTTTQEPYAEITYGRARAPRKDRRGQGEGGPSRQQRSCQQRCSGHTYVTPCRHCNAFQAQRVPLAIRRPPWTSRRRRGATPPCRDAPQGRESSPPTSPSRPLKDLRCTRDRRGALPHPGRARHRRQRFGTQGRARIFAGAAADDARSGRRDRRASRQRHVLVTRHPLHRAARR